MNYGNFIQERLAGAEQSELAGEYDMRIRLEREVLAICRVLEERSDPPALELYKQICLMMTALHLMKSGVLPPNELRDFVDIYLVRP